MGLLLLFAKQMKMIFLSTTLIDYPVILSSNSYGLSEILIRNTIYRQRQPCLSSVLSIPDNSVNNSLPNFAFYCRDSRKMDIIEQIISGGMRNL